MPVAWEDALFGNNPATSLYKRPYGPDGRILPESQWWGYNRLTQVTNQPERFPRRWANLKTVAEGIEPGGMGTADRILVVGCAYGFLIEVALDDGYTNIWGIDNSSYVDTNTGTEMRADVQARFLADDIVGGGSMRARLRTLTGDDQFDWIISESVLESFAPGQELDGLLGAANAGLLQGVPESHVIHLAVMNPGGQPAPPDWVAHGMTWLTLAEWHSQRPAQTYVMLNSDPWQVL